MGTIGKLKLIDKINLACKLGARAVVPFTPEEQTLLNLTRECVSYKDVISVARLISEFAPTTKQEDTQDLPGETEEETEGEQTPNANSNPDSTDTDEKGEDSESVDDGTDDDEDVSDTQNHFDEKMKDMVQNTNNQEVVYCNVPTAPISEFVIDIKTLRQSFGWTDNTVTYLTDQFSQFMSSIKRDVNFMVQQFEMKKSADAYARQSVHKTGVLNTAQLHNYKLTDDLFLRQTVTPDGKSHGMVMLLDWSGSMADHIVSTVKQLIVMTQFCRKVGIPYDVYTFTTGRHVEENIIDRNVTTNDMMLVNVLSSSAKRNDQDTDIKHLFFAANGLQRFGCSPGTPYLAMGGTPLNNVLTIMPRIISDFKQRTRSQKVSFVCLTDGESGSLSFYRPSDREYVTHLPYYVYWDRVLLRDGHNIVDLGLHMGMTGRLAKWIGDMDGVTVTNIYIGSLKSCESYLVGQGLHAYDMDSKQFRTENATTVKSENWLICLMSPKGFGDSPDELEVNDGATKTQIRTALRRHLKAKQSSKRVLSQFITQIS